MKIAEVLKAIGVIGNEGIKRISLDEELTDDQVYNLVELVERPWFVRIWDREDGPIGIYGYYDPHEALSFCERAIAEDQEVEVYTALWGNHINVSLEAFKEYCLKGGDEL